MSSILGYIARKRTSQESWRRFRQLENFTWTKVTGRNRLFCAARNCPEFVQDRKSVNDEDDCRTVLPCYLLARRNQTGIRRALTQVAAIQQRDRLTWRRMQEAGPDERIEGCWQRNNPCSPIDATTRAGTCLSGLCHGRHQVQG